MYMNFLKIKSAWITLLIVCFGFVIHAGEDSTHSNLIHILRIAVVSDTHVNFGTNQQIYASNFKKVISQVNTADVDVVAITGDLTENGTRQEYSEFQNLVKNFKAPVLVLPGNHDIGNKKQGKTTNEVSTERLAIYHAVFGKSWFAFKVNGFKLIGLNSCLFGSGLDTEKEMWEFLRFTFEEQDPSRVLVFAHYPLFVDRVDEPGSYSNIDPAYRSELLALFQKHKVLCYCSGHLHRSITNNYEGILCYSAPPVSYGLSGQKVGWALITVSNMVVRIEQKFIAP